MMINQTHKSLLVVFILGVVLFGLAACSPVTPEEETLVPENTQPATEIVEESPPVPTPTSTLEPPAVMLLFGEGADAEKVDRLQAVLADLAAESSLEMRSQEGLTGESLPANVQVVVAVALDLDPAALAGANPGVRFVFVDQDNAAPGENLSVIGEPTLDQQRQSFMAGYLAALVSSDYKVAGLIPADHSLSPVMREAFIVGVEFFCGVCNPLYPPFQNFPQLEQLPGEAAVDGFQPVVDTLVINGVEILYLQGSLASQELLTYLAEQNIQIVSDETPGSLRSNWVGSVLSDPVPALVDLWPGLLQGTGGVQVPSSIRLTDTESGLLSEGRRRMFEEMAEKLDAGLVSPESNP